MVARSSLNCVSSAGRHHGGRRRSSAKKSPGAAKPRKVAEPKQSAADGVKVDLGDQVVRVLLHDANGMKDTRVRVPNSLWPHGDDDGWDANGTTDATVVGACEKPFDFGGARACQAYIIRTDDDGQRTTSDEDQ